MNPPPEEFENLRKLLALKRHEQPPPGYFDQLPGRIAARLNAGEAKLTFWEQLTAAFTIRPALACAFGLTLCATLAMMLASSTRFDPSLQTTADQLPGSALNQGIPNPVLSAQINSTDAAPIPLHVAGWSAGTNPVAPAQSQPSLFGPSNSSTPVVPVSFSH